MQHFVAVAVFCFLPYCQLTGANVSVDIFTENVSERAKAAMVAFSSLFAIVFSAVMLRQMSLGFVSYIQYPETTATLHIPLWTAFPPALLSLALLFVAAVITLIQGWPRHARAVGVPLGGGGKGERMEATFLIGLAGLVALLALIVVRVPIAYTMILVGAVGAAIESGPDVVLYQLKDLAYSQFANYDLSVLPMFILMGSSGGTLRPQPRPLPRRRCLVRALPRRRRHGGGGRLRRLRRGVRLVDRDRLDHGHRRPAGAQALQIRAVAGHRHDRRRRHARHPHPALGRPHRLRHHRPDQHRHPVRGGADPRPARRRHVPDHGGDLCAPGARRRTAGRGGVARRVHLGDARHGADPGDLRRRHRRHLWRPLQSDAGRRHRRVPGRRLRLRPPAADAARDDRGAARDGAHDRHDLSDPARRGAPVDLHGARRGSPGGRRAACRTAACRR